MYVNIFKYMCLNICKHIHIFEYICIDFLKKTALGYHMRKYYLHFMSSFLNF